MCYVLFFCGKNLLYHIGSLLHYTLIEFILVMYMSNSWVLEIR